MPLRGYALQDLASAVLEPEVGRRKDVFEPHSHQHFRGTGQAHDPGPDVNCCSSELLSHDLGLSQVQADPNVDTEFLDRFDNGGGASDGISGNVESREEAIARRVELAAAVSAQFAADQRVVAGQQDPPPAIAQLGNQVGGPNDVGEQEGGEHALSTGPLHAPSIRERAVAGNGYRKQLDPATLGGGRWWFRTTDLRLVRASKIAT
jgi:hypothetical protein